GLLICASAALTGPWWTSGSPSPTKAVATDSRTSTTVPLGPRTRISATHLPSENRDALGTDDLTAVDVEPSDTVGELVFRPESFRLLDVRDVRASRAVERECLGRVGLREILRRHHPEAQQVPDRRRPEASGGAGDISARELRIGAQQERLELGVDHEHTAAERDVRLVQDLSKVPDDIVRLITCGDRGGVEDVPRVGLRHSRSQDELVGVLGKPGRCGPRVRVHATGRLCAVDVVDVEVENLLLV